MESFFTSVNRSYDRVGEAIDVAKTGRNLELARFLVNNPKDGAIYWNDQAIAHLKELREDKVLSPWDASRLFRSVLTPLGDMMGRANEAITRGRDPLLRYEDAWKDAVLSVVAGTTGFFGEKWKLISRSYGLIDAHIRDLTELVARISGLLPLPEVAVKLDLVRVDIRTLQAHKRRIEALVQSAGIPVEALQESAQEAGLGVIQLLAAKITLPVIGAVTVGSILAVVGTALGIIATAILFDLGTGALHLVGLGSIAIWAAKKRIETDEEARRLVESERAKMAEKLARDSSGEIERATENNIKTAQGLMDAIGAPEDEKMKYVNAVDQERKKAGLPGLPKEVGIFPYILAGALGLGAAGFVYYIRTKKSTTPG